MTRLLEVTCRNLLFVCIAFVPVRAQGQGKAQILSLTLASQIHGALASQPKTQTQRALVIKTTSQIATSCWMFFSFISLPGPWAITSPRSITRYWSASSSAKS